jgi:cold shock CspA family protein
MSSSEPDLFSHKAAEEMCLSNLGCRAGGRSGLNEGQVVEYEEVANRGKTSAENVKV